MRTIIVVTMLAFVLIGSAASAQTVTVQTPAAQEGVFRGEVWTWDERENTVTLRQTGGKDIRVRITPDQFRVLRLHEQAVVRGELLGPASLETVIAPAGPMRAVPRGPQSQSDVTGTISAVDPRGTIQVDTPQGRLVLWVAAPEKFKQGSTVSIHMAAQPVDMVADAVAPATPGLQVAPPEPAASVSSEPGDYAVILGRVLAVDATRITVESTRGPVTVAVADSALFPPGSSAQVRTIVRAPR